MNVRVIMAGDARRPGDTGSTSSWRSSATCPAPTSTPSSATPWPPWPSYYSELQADDRAMPGTDDGFDEQTAGLARPPTPTGPPARSCWRPTSMSWPRPATTATRVLAFRDADGRRRGGRGRRPRLADRRQAEDLVASARDLADSVNRYPAVAAVDREVAFNTFAPFYKAPLVYGLGFVLLGLCLMFGGGTGTTHGGVADGPLRRRPDRPRRRHRPGGLRLLATRADLRLGPGDEPVRDGHLGRPGRRRHRPGPRGDLPPRLPGRRRRRRGDALHDHLGQCRERPEPEHRGPQSGPPQQLLADDPRPDDRLQLRGLRPGAWASV